MKYLKLFESFEDIDSICRKYGISNYSINDDGSIDVRGNVDLSNRGLTKLPLKFRNVSRGFYCDRNQLVSLEGCPVSVGSNFSCGNNKLVSLEGAPQSVGGNFSCNDNQLVSLEGCPQSVGGNFWCFGNPIYSLVGSWISEYSDSRSEMIEYFNELDIVQGDKVIMDRLEDFMDTYGVEIDLEKVKKHYKIV